MHAKLREAIIASVRLRSSQGDCPIEPAHSVEMLEHVILDLAPEERRDEVGRLSDGEWFYPEGDHSSDECRFSPDEVIDYALEAEWKSKVVAIERAASLPTVYAAVHVYSDAEKNARGSDDEYDYTLFATHKEAVAALTPVPGER